MRPKPLLLLVLDGFGYREATEHNAIHHAKMPHWDALWAKHSHTLLDCQGLAVGLPEGQMGNSEVGHMNLGCGRVIYQKFTEIAEAIRNGSFYQNAVFLQTMQKLKKENTLHVFGLLSPGGVHSHECQIEALLQMAAMQGVQKLAVHAFLDGRDTPPQSAAASLIHLQKTCALIQQKQNFDYQIATLSGRYYAMDRDKRWDRTKKAYDLLIGNQAKYSYHDAITALEAAYARGETDEFVFPSRIEKTHAIQDDDAIIFMNFRPDRARQITQAFVDPQNQHFEQSHQPKLSSFITLAPYGAQFNLQAAFPNQEYQETLGEILAQQGLSQLRIAETEKYAHVTFFFNGGIEKPFSKEERILIDSPKVATYDLKPEMSVYEVTEALVKAILEQRHDVIVANFANADMVGHTGNMQAAILALEAIDACLGKLNSALKKVEGEMLITADHGNVEEMEDASTGQNHTAHTHNLVPLLYVGRATPLRAGGKLSDVAPTMLELLGINKPRVMTGESLLQN